MADKITGIHHITAIAGNAKRNLDFYTRALGLRMVKRTVNFDDPGTYHFYYGNENGAPGTILTFFPWEGIVRGRTGTGMATEIGYSVNRDSLPFWADRFRELKVSQGATAERMGEVYLPFQDPDGLNISLIASNDPDDRKPWSTPEIAAEVGTKGFHSVTLTLRDIVPTASILTDVFGYRQERQEGNRYRFRTDAIPTAAIVDLVEAPNEGRGLNGGGTNHHVAFRVADEEMQMAYREKILSRGLHITPKINRDYFYSLYFREPGGVLFELATDNPGFTVDEPLAELGTHLKLPVQYEPMRAAIEQSLPALS
ncbi:MAG TPA: ring-cleaving dioxygenase [Puia sp.]|jgi:glyoxalase family protein|nr:ring-cleaving dioxygenase [Puia sp.]